jgi:hypothetical protein
VSTSPNRRSELYAEKPTCDGPAVAMLLRKIIDAFGDMPALDRRHKTDCRYCEICRPTALQVIKVLQDMLVPYAKDLEEIEVHRYNGGNIDSSLVSDKSPPTRRLSREYPSVLICDFSDEDII